jgi:cell division protein FtsN
VAAKRGKSQARRNGANSGGLPGWAWLVLGIVLTLAVVLMAPKFMKPGGGDGFFRPKPNPDATPAPTSDGDDESIAGDGDAPPAPATKTDTKPKPTQYDFYTMLPGDEVQMSDAEIAATAREEAARHAAAQAAAQRNEAASPAANVEQPANPLQSMATTPATDAAGDAPYLLQAGAFGASGDAEATKAKVALLGLSARVESAQLNGKTVYRVRMGPYSTASELAEAKRKLASGGLPAMAIKVK